MRFDTDGPNRVTIDSRFRHRIVTGRGLSAIIFWYSNEYVTETYTRASCRTGLKARRQRFSWAGQRDARGPRTYNKGQFYKRNGHARLQYLCVGGYVCAWCSRPFRSG